MTLQQCQTLARTSLQMRVSERSALLSAPLLFARLLSSLLTTALGFTHVQQHIWDHSTSERRFVAALFVISYFIIVFFFFTSPIAATQLGHFWIFNISFLPPPPLPPLKWITLTILIFLSGTLTRPQQVG